MAANHLKNNFLNEIKNNCTENKQCEGTCICHNSNCVCDNNKINEIMNDEAGMSKDSIPIDEKVEVENPHYTP